jgi:phage replication initiation protein
MSSISQAGVSCKLVAGAMGAAGGTGSPTGSGGGLHDPAGCGRPDGAEGSRVAGVGARAGLCLPPDTNRGVTSTSPIVDWVEGTFLGCTVEEGLERCIMVAGEITELPRGCRGYSKSGVIAGTGRVGWSPEYPSFGVHISLPASALGSSRFGDVRGLLSYMESMGFRGSRIDFAIDDHVGILDLDVISRAIAGRAFVSPVHGGGEITSWARSRDVEVQGRTLYLGSRASESYMRIYDKAAESHLSGHWVRVELELKGKKAAAAVRELVKTGPSIVAGWFRQFVDFVDQHLEDSNRSRWSTCTWWAAFLGGVNKAALLVVQTERTLARLAAWVSRTVAPSLACLVAGEGPGWLDEQVRRGFWRMSPVQLGLLRGLGSSQ